MILTTEQKDLFAGLAAISGIASTVRAILDEMPSEGEAAEVAEFAETVFGEKGKVTVNRIVAILRNTHNELEAI